MTPLLRQFVVEGRESIASAVDGLLALERHPDDAGRIDQVFRAIHTLKGSAGLFQYGALTAVLHAAEDLLVAVRAGHLRAAEPVVDLLLECLDWVEKGLDALDVAGQLPAGADEPGAGLVARLRGQLPTADAAAVADATPVAPVTTWIERLTAAERDALGRLAGGRLVAVAYEPDPRCFYVGDDPIELIRGLPGLALLRVEPREPWPQLAEMDPFACNLRLFAVAATTLEAARQLFRTVSDQTHIALLPSVAPATPAGAMSLVLAEQQHLAAAAVPGPGFAGVIGSAARTAAAALQFGGRGDEAGRMRQAGDEAVVAGTPAPLLAALARAAGEPNPAPAPTPVPAEEGPVARLLRVEERRVDRLVDLVGELIVAKNALGTLAARTPDDGAAPELARTLGQHCAALDRLARELYDAVLQVRMLPMAEVFRRFPRLVRDAARQLGKMVALEMRGEDTEIDKAVMEALHEPLLHLIRNAIDHGLEVPDERRRAGKPETGRLVLTAAQAAKQVVITVEDDGRGIDPDRMRAAAVAGGLLDAAAAAALGDQQAVELIFAPGLTTRPAASEISGRGIGLDAVNVAARRIGGQVTVHSTRGHGTSVRLTVPLSLSLTRIMTVRAGGQDFGIPIEIIVETLRLPRARLQEVMSQRAVVLRERVVPVRRLGRLLGLDAATAPPAGADMLLVVVESRGRLVAVEVDAIGGRLDAVLRPLDGLLAGLPHYLGTTLTGEGAVLLVLDLRELV